jgi:hypothetical protein
MPYRIIHLAASKPGLPAKAQAVRLRYSKIATSTTLSTRGDGNLKLQSTAGAKLITLP